MICNWYRYVRVVAYVLLSVITFAGGRASAQLSGDELDRQANQIYQQVFSPFCPGRSLNDCPSSKAHDLKKDMRHKLEQGVPPEVVLEQVFTQYGDQYRAVPQYAGFGRLVWWAPALFLALGSVIALIIARGNRVGCAAAVNTQPDDSAEAQATLSHSELRARIEAELAHLD
jgi:cytochrome c-type biogenesis protein CcmH/NrfF